MTQASAAAAMSGFTEQAPHEAGFAAIFASEIAPALTRLEQERQAQKRKIWQRLGLTLVAAIVLLAIAAAAFPNVAVFIIIIVAAVIAIFAYALAPARTFTDRVRDVVMGPVCRFLGDLSYSRDGNAFDVHPFVDCGVVGSFNRRSVEDVFTGRHRGTGFAMGEAWLRRVSHSGAGKNRRQQTHTVFRGLLIAVDVPVPFSGRILIGRDHGGIGNALFGWFEGFRSMQRITVPHAEFERRYQLYADDPALPEKLLSPAFLETMIALADAEGKSALTAGFYHGRFLLGLPMRGPLFETGSVWRPTASYEADFHAVLRQVTIAHRLIDHLHGDRPGSLR